jgi:hypothetical protein
MNACEQCGCAYDPAAIADRPIKFSRKRFCSRKCESGWRHAHPKRPACTCGRCGKLFIPKEADRTKFCSRECAFEFKKAAPKFCAVEFRACSVCGKVTRRNQCSSECRKEHERIEAMRRYESHKPTDPIVKRCECWNRT